MQAMCQLHRRDDCAKNESSARGKNARRRDSRRAIFGNHSQFAEPRKRLCERRFSYQVPDSAVGAIGRGVVGVAKVSPPRSIGL